MASPVRDRSREGDPKLQLLQAGKQLFSQHGLEGTTVRDLAKAANVNPCLVSYYFEGKEGLYRACIEEFGKSRLENAQRLLGPVESVEEFRVRLKLVIGAILDSNLREPEMHRMISRELEAGLPVAREVFEQVFLKLSEMLMGFVKSAQKSRIVRADADPYYLTCMIHGTLLYLTRMQTVAGRYFNRSIAEPRNQEKLVENLVRTLLEGTLIRTGEST